ncbi:MAG: rod shape-determining protein RodA [Draconibacterium sp.]|nr:MAG: rod shape-determining protein RodA [Draconibacterium sp.]
MAKRNNMWANIDGITILLYLLLVFLGWINIYAAVYNTEHQSILDITQRYGKQLIFIGAAVVLAFFILIIESNFYSVFAYLIYGFMIFLLVLVLFVGKEVNGGRSWFSFGGFGFQPSEFCKFATALALAKYVSTHPFKNQSIKTYLIPALIIFLPAAFIVVQNDTGSALVYFAFILVLYREGLSAIVLFFGTLIAVLFIVALVLPNLTLSLILLALALVAYYVFSLRSKVFPRIVAVFVSSILIFIVIDFMVKSDFKMADCINAGLILGSLISLGIAIRKRISNITIVSLVLFASVLFTISVDYAFNNLLEPHHQARINETLGIESNPLGAGYNVNQSKIAIGSGGFSGKGFLKGTQTKFDFVPEQSTDFIFCTVGEEWGFIGTLTVISLFITLFIRLILLAERQRSAFSRIYGYSVAVILFFHFMVNVGMTIGIMPVIGIPLPFFSYGGSSLWSFTILLFIFIRMDASRYEKF